MAAERSRALGRVVAGFVHLRVKSCYSMLEGAVRPKELASLATSMSMPAVAVCDTNNLFGAFDVSETVAKAAVQPITGTLLSVDLEDGPPVAGMTMQQKPPLLPLLAQNETGYRNLNKLLSAAYLEAAPGDYPHVKADRLAEFSEGLIALTGGPGGPLNKLLAEGQIDAGEAVLDKLSAIFGDRLYIELQRHGLAEERAAEKFLIDFAYDKGLPLVATNDVHFGREDMYEAHDALLCIADSTYVSQTDRKKLTREHRFKTPAEMIAQFADLPEAIDNTIEIARRCAFRPRKHKPILPQFEPESGLPPQEELKRLAEEGLARRLAESGLYAERAEYDTRLAYELGIINRMDFPGYFLIVSDFMKWTRAHRIPVGVRGSGAASLVAWSLDITNLDPLRFGLLFERFLNPERISMPDFDIDFCQERRDEVVHYVQHKYGVDRVAHIMALGSLQARAAVRDVGRVLQLPLGLVDRIAKLIPNPPGKPVSMEDALLQEPRLNEIADSEPAAKRLFSIVRKVEGLYRHTSTHPAGIVIGDRPLDELVPLYRDPRSDMPVTQFDYEDAEKSGLVKFDFLGLKTLTVIAKAEELLKRRGIELNTQAIDFEDKPTFEMLARGDSVGVFQLESTGMRDLMRKMKPDHINDLVALVALYRPGPMDSIPKYIACKNGKEAPEYLDPKLEPILKDTYGVMTYQEDVMSIARELGGYSMGEADLLRRAMGKKIVSEMATHREKFVKGAQGARRRSQDRRPDLRTGREICGLRFQQGPCRGLCAGRLSDGLSEGELSGRISGRFDDAGYRQHRPAQHLPPGGAAPRHRGAAAGHQPLRSAVLLRSRKGCRLLRAGRRQRRGPPGDGSCRGGARRGRAVQVDRRFRPPHRSAAGQQALLSKTWRGPAPSTGSIPIAASSWNRRCRAGRCRRAMRASAKAGSARCSARSRMRGRRICASRRSPTGCRMSGWARNSAPSASISPAIRSTITRPRSSACRSRPMRNARRTSATPS